MGGGTIQYTRPHFHMRTYLMLPKIGWDAVGWGWAGISTSCCWDFNMYVSIDIQLYIYII